MDDWIVLSNNKYQLRRFIKKINETLAGLKLVKAKDKTYVGKLTNGFDFLGFHFKQKSITVSNKTVVKFLNKLTAKVHSWMNRFYESGLYGLKKMKGESKLAEIISLYAKNWLRWYSLKNNFQIITKHS